MLAPCPTERCALWMVGSIGLSATCAREREPGRAIPKRPTHGIALGHLSSTIAKLRRNGGRYSHGLCAATVLVRLSRAATTAAPMRGKDSRCSIAKLSPSHSESQLEDRHAPSEPRFGETVVAAPTGFSTPLFLFDFLHRRRN